MKRLFSKKSGFTLVEIVIAFAIFAIMALMVTQILNLTVTRRTANSKFEKDLQTQEQTLVAKGQKMEYDTTKGNDGKLSLQFKDQDGNDLPMDLNYQLRSADGTVGEVDGINYFVGDITYAEGFDHSEYIPPEGGDDPTDPADIGGGSQMSRFDTRITGTKGINSVTVSYTYDSAADEYTVTVTVDASGVAASMKNHAQVTLFFGEDAPGGKLATIKEVEGGNKTQSSLKYVKKCGTNGVNIHCPDGGFNGAKVFKVKLNEKLDSLGFGSGDNVSGNTYTMYKTYANIFGAYEKATS